MLYEVITDGFARREIVEGIEFRIFLKDHVIWKHIAHGDYFQVLARFNGIVGIAKIRVFKGDLIAQLVIVS